MASNHWSVCSETICTTSVLRTNDFWPTRDRFANGNEGGHDQAFMNLIVHGHVQRTLVPDILQQTTASTVGSVWSETYRFNFPSPKPYVNNQRMIIESWTSFFDAILPSWKLSNDKNRVEFIRPRHTWKCSLAVPVPSTRLWVLPIAVASCRRVRAQ